MLILFVLIDHHHVFHSFCKFATGVTDTAGKFAIGEQLTAGAKNP
jgi:hypothetical protein